MNLQKLMRNVWEALPSMGFHDEKRINFVKKLHQLDRAISKATRPATGVKNAAAVERGRLGGLTRATNRRAKVAADKAAWEAQLATAQAYRTLLDP